MRFNSGFKGLIYLYQVENKVLNVGASQFIILTNSTVKIILCVFCGLCSSSSVPKIQNKQKIKKSETGSVDETA
jgi:hypothetical protein